MCKTVHLLEFEVILHYNAQLEQLRNSHTVCLAIFCWIIPVLELGVQERINLFVVFYRKG